MNSFTKTLLFSILLLSALLAISKSISAEIDLMSFEASLNNDGGYK